MSTPGESPRLLFEDAPIAYHEIDREGRISRVNRAECAMLGYDRSDEGSGRPRTQRSRCTAGHSGNQPSTSRSFSSKSSGQS